jgi:hypothetical protein
MTIPVLAFPLTRPPPIESLGVAYFMPLLAPLLVTTRTPQPAPNQDTTTEFLRLQSGGGAQRENWYFWDMTLLLHSYAPNSQETTAEDNLAIAVAWGAAAQGQTITLKNGDSYYVTYSRASGLSHRLGDPYVDAIRYRSMIMWRVAGKPMA